MYLYYMHQNNTCHYFGGGDITGDFYFLLFCVVQMFFKLIPLL